MRLLTLPFIGLFYRHQNKRLAGENLVILWSTVAGFYHIYVNGTFVVFSSVMGTGSVVGSSFWMNSLWQLVGQLDPR